MAPTSKYFCNECGRGCATKQSVERHLFRKHFPTLKRHLCPECGATYGSKTDLDRHIRFVHRIEASFPCPKCPKAFRYKASFRAHLSSHSSQRPWACPYCPATFKLKSTLAAHRTNVHKLSLAAAVRCSLCDKFFKSAQHVRNHVTAAHKRDIRAPAGRFLRCHLCPLLFKRKDRMREHLFSRHLQDAEKAFGCSLCDYRAHFQFAVNRHMRTKHQVEPWEALLDADFFATLFLQD